MSDPPSAQARIARRRIETLEQELERNPDDVAARVELARRHFALAREAEQEARRNASSPAAKEREAAYRRVLEAAQEALVRAPAHVEATRLLGEGYAGIAGCAIDWDVLAEPDWIRAVHAFVSVTHWRPHDAEAYRRVAWCSFWLGAGRLQIGMDGFDPLSNAASMQMQAVMLDPARANDSTLTAMYHDFWLTAEARRHGKQRSALVQRPGAAVCFWTRRVRLNPRDAEDRACLGAAQWLASRRGGKVTRGADRALRTLAHALRLDPRHFEARFATGVILRVVAQSLEEGHPARERRLKSAIATLRSAVRREPRRPRAHAELARAALERARPFDRADRENGPALRLALGACRRARALDPDDLDSLVLLGETHHALGLAAMVRRRAAWDHFQAAADAFAEAWRRAPEEPLHLASHVRSLTGRAKSLFERGRDARDAYTRAIHACASLFEVEPEALLGLHEYREMHYELAQAHVRSGSDAAPSFDQALALAVREVAAGFQDVDLQSIAEDYARWRQGRGEDPRPPLRAAIRDLEAAWARAPKSSQLDQAAELWSRCGRWETTHGLDAGVAFERAVEASRRAMSAPDASREELLRLDPLEDLARWQRAHAVDAGPTEKEWDEVLAGMDPGSPVEMGYVFAWANRAEYALEFGADPQPALARASALQARILSTGWWGLIRPIGRANLRRLRAQVRQARGEDVRAELLAVVRDLDAAQRRIPDHTSGLLVKAAALRALGRRAALLRCLERARKLDEGDAGVEWKIARLTPASP